MVDLTQELVEELEAFDPKWQQHYASMEAAAHAAGVSPLYAEWLKSDAGRRYLTTFTAVPDHVGVSRRRAEAELQQPASLPFGFQNIGKVRTTDA